MKILRLRGLMALALILISTTTFAFAKDQNPGLKLDNEEWMVFNNETVYPILDNLHALLNSAYVAFENKNYDEAVAHFKAGAANLRSQSESQEAPYRYKSLSAALGIGEVHPPLTSFESLASTARRPSVRWNTPSSRCCETRGSVKGQSLR